MPCARNSVFIHRNHKLDCVKASDRRRPAVKITTKLSFVNKKDLPLWSWAFKAQASQMMQIGAIDDLNLRNG
jgi:hypothetical protein